MAVKAYFFIRSTAEADRSRDAGWIRDLEAMPEVQRVHRVLGQYDLLVAVRTPESALRVADRILANSSVERLAICYSPIGPELRPRAA